MSNVSTCRDRANANRGRSHVTAQSSNPARIDLRPIMDAGRSDEKAARTNVPKLALTPMEACLALSVSHDFFRASIAGELRWVRRGRKKLVSVRELERWLETNSARLLEEAA
jgi:hypothetical protein